MIYSFKVFLKLFFKLIWYIFQNYLFYLFLQKLNIFYTIFLNIKWFLFHFILLVTRRPCLILILLSMSCFELQNQLILTYPELNLNISENMIQWSQDQSNLLKFIMCRSLPYYYVIVKINLIPKNSLLYLLIYTRPRLIWKYLWSIVLLRPLICHHLRYLKCLDSKSASASTLSWRLF